MTQNAPPSLQPQSGASQDEIRKIISPLVGVDPKSLDALMAEDVELLSDADVDAIVGELRRVRASWLREEAVREAKPRVVRAKPGEKGTKTVSLKDLGF